MRVKITPQVKEEVMMKRIELLLCNDLDQDEMEFVKQFDLTTCSFSDYMELDFLHSLHRIISR